MADQETATIPALAATPTPATGGATPDKPSGAPVPPATGGGQPATAAANPVRPALFGGHRGGKKTGSGFPVGSPEHAKWAREQDAERKRRKRAADAAAVAAQAVIPAALPKPGDLQPPPAAGAFTASPPDLGGVPCPSSPALVSWYAKDVAPIIRELIALLEELAGKQIIEKCRKAKLPPELIREIEADIKWAERSKKMLEEGLAELTAKQLNQSEIPVEVRPWMQALIGAVQISIGHLKVLKRLDAVILAANGTPKPQPEEVNP